MNQLLKRVGRGATVVLTSTMLLIAVVKAQGCKNDPQPADAPVSQPPVEVQTTGAPDTGPDPSPPVDAGTDAGGAQRLDVGEGAANPFGNFAPTRMFPASKSGGFEFEGGPSPGGLGLKGAGTGGAGLSDIMRDQGDKPQTQQRQRPQQQNQAPE